MKHNTQIATLIGKDVERLSSPDRGTSLAISFYLGVRADRDFLSVANSYFSEEGKRISGSRRFSKNDKELIAEIFNDMEKRLRAIKLPDRTRTFIVFFDDKGKMKMYKVPVYIPSRLVVEKDLYIHPFIKNLQKYPRYAVIFLSRDRAKIFNYFWGEVEDETDEIRSEVPQRMNAARASWKGLSEKRILKHIEVHIDRHLKKVAQAAEKYMTDNRIPYLIIESHEELIERFKRHLPSLMRRKIVGSYLIRTDQNLKRIQEKGLEIIDRFELEKENEIISQLMEGNSKKAKGAVLGIEPVLQKLREFKIHILVIGKNYTKSGYLCPDNHSVHTGMGDTFVCRVPMSEAGDMADEIIETAIARKIKIMHFLHNHKDFDEFGIGAILK